VSGERLKGNLDMLLLAIVSQGPSHGYGIIEKLRSRSNEAFDLPEGTVYPALHRLERAGLLDSTWSDAEGRRRRVYRLGPSGQSALAERTTEWEAFTRSVHLVLEGA
jgi:DNA-binding PadR family transcriptional regulator